MHDIRKGGEWYQVVIPSLPDDLIKQRVEDFMKQFQDVLLDEIPTGVELNRKFKAQIVLKEGAQPVQKKPYPLPLSLEEPLKETITYLLERGIIQPSSSEFALPIIFTKKADGSLRFCTDLHTTDFRAGRKNWSDDSARTTRELECAECTIIYLKYGLSSLVLATRSES